MECRISYQFASLGYWAGEFLPRRKVFFPVKTHFFPLEGKIYISSGKTPNPNYNTISLCLSHNQPLRFVNYKSKHNLLINHQVSIHSHIVIYSVSLSVNKLYEFTIIYKTTIVSHTHNTCSIH